MPGQICRPQPEITVLKFQDSPGLANVTILKCHRGIRGVLGLGKLAGLPALTKTRFLAPFFAEPQWWPFRGASSPAAPQLGQKALKEPPVATSPGPCCADTAAACCWLRCQKVLTETRKRNFGSSFWEAGDIGQLVERILGQQHSGPLRRRKRARSHNLTNSVEGEHAP